MIVMLNVRLVTERVLSQVKHHKLVRAVTGVGLLLLFVKLHWACRHVNTLEARLQIIF